MKRRSFLKFGTAGLLIAGGLGWLGKEFAKVKVVAGKSVVLPEHQPMVEAVIRGILGPAMFDQSPQSMSEAVSHFSQTSMTLAAHAQAELGQLLNIMENPVGRRLLGKLGNDWRNASVEQVQTFLTNFKNNPIPALQPGYLALHDLVYASWYARSTHWRAIGYPGPPYVLR